MTEPKLSLIVPIYNTLTYLNRCLTSIKNQEFLDFEVILVNDGSTDQSELFCKEFIKKDSRFKLFTKPNGGLSSARNYGVAHAKGKYICYIDSDDYIDKNYCETLYQKAILNDVDILNFGFKYKRGKAIEKRASILPKNILISKNKLYEVLSDSSNNKVLWYACVNIYRRQFLLDHHIVFDEKVQFGEDSIYNLLCYIKANKIESISTSLYNYMYNAESLTQSKFKPRLLEKYECQFNARLIIHKKHKDISEIKYYNDIAKNYVENSYFMLLGNLIRFHFKEKKEELIKMRNSEIYAFSFKYWEPSKILNFKMKIKIYLFKYRLYTPLAFILKLK